MAAKGINVVIEVIEYATCKVVKTRGPMPERKADLVERGMMRNLDQEHFFTSSKPVAAKRVR